MKSYLIKILKILLLSVSLLYAKEKTAVKLVDFSTRNFAVQSFKVIKSIDVTVKSFGSLSRSKSLVARAWILRSGDRQVVWKMKKSGVKRRSRFLVELKEKIKLSAGCYELYFAVEPETRFVQIRGVSDLVDGLINRERITQRRRRAALKWGVELSVDEAEFSYITVTQKCDCDFKPVVSITPVEDNSGLSEGFALCRPADLRVYAIGEGTSRVMDDYGWIIDEDRCKVVWKMDYKRTVNAGGAAKNRKIDEVISLPAGNYRVYFVTDNSHSFEEWNAMPPDDPYFYGITLWETDSDGSTVSDYVNRYENNIIADLSKAGRDRLYKKVFRLNKPMNVRILALGEMSGSSFADYGWMLNLYTREVVWSMKKSNTMHAGGARKNRMFFNTIHLEPGTYEVMFLTDDSHSFGRWNEAPPFNPDAWGVTIWTEDEFSAEDVEKDVFYRDDNVIACIKEVKNNQHRKVHFRIKNGRKVRIYSIGEAEGPDRFYDFGWIEDSSGKIVWKPEYRMAKPAGGARKNIKIDTEIYLNEGAYTLHYKSDGSHAFGRWNSSPPYDPEYWGICVMEIINK